jgi:hypothetical protein
MGNRLPLKLVGTLNIDKGQSYTNLDIRDQILESFQKQRFISSLRPTEPLFEFDLQVNAAEAIKVKNRGVDATLSTNLSVKGTDVFPTLGGAISIPSGTFLYKREFRITHGDITFDELVSPPDPRLNITGETAVSGYTVTVNVSGLASDVKIALAIDPSTRSDGSPINEKDILMLWFTPY